MASHMTFVLISYGLAALIFAGLLIWLFATRNYTIRQLEKLEREGITRRADDAGTQG